MKKRAGFVVACAAALLTCSCASQAELERARAEAEAARAEAAKAKADLNELRAHLNAEQMAEAAARVERENARAAAAAAKAKAAKFEEELRTRWNAVGPGTAVGGFGTFEWRGPNAFPHPTFKGGSAEAYTAFVKVLVAFLETGDNFEFMAKNDLFAADIGYGLGATVKIGPFAAVLAKPGSLGAGDEPTRKKLEALVAKIKAPPKV